MQNKEFNIKNYKFTELEKGRLGTVFCIEKNNKKYTCKQIENTIKNVDRYLNELNNIKILKGINLPKFYNFVSTKSYVYLLYEFVPGKDLYYILKEYEIKIKQNFKLIATIIYEITLGLQELFIQNMIHLDLKPENIIISSLKPVKLTLIDLEFCKSLNNCKREPTTSGTLGWSSPEVILYNTYYYNTDIWSLGLILYTLFTGKYLFSTKCKEEYIDMMRNFQDINDIQDFNITNIPENGYDLMNNMIQPLHINRYTIDQVLNCSFLKSINK